MVVARLEPFREAQISQWLRVWNDANAGLAARGLQPLAPQTALEHAELASQPLLLIMLALYDADGNPLQRADAALGEAELYERLLTSFAEREVRKSGADLPDEAVRERGRTGTAAPICGGVRDVFTAAASGSATPSSTLTCARCWARRAAKPTRRAAGAAQRRASGGRPVLLHP